MSNKVFLFGYSGHARVVCDILLSAGYQLAGYYTETPVKDNPYDIPYSGFESDPRALAKLENNEFFIAVGNNSIRKKITEILIRYTKRYPCGAMAASAVFSSKAQKGFGVMVGPSSVINSGAIIGNGAICNTGSIIEHECVVGDFVHVAPGAILCGNVTVGENSFIGAGSVIKEGVLIGKNVIIGAGTVVIKNVPDGKTIVGNPQRIVR